MFWERFGKIPTSYFEHSMREMLGEQADLHHVCSLSADPGSLAMWSLYAERHAGIVFGISSSLDRVIADKGRDLIKMAYSPRRSHTPINNPKFEDIVSSMWTKGTDWEHQQEWRIISETGTFDFLECGEVKEVIFGYRYDPNVSGDKAEHMRRAFRDTKFFDASPSPTEHRIMSVPIISPAANRQSPDRSTNSGDHNQAPLST